MDLKRYASLRTEKINPRSLHIDRVSIREALKIINEEDASVPKAVGAARKSIEQAVKLVVSSLSSGGRMFLMGAGTSGRLAVLEAAECPPTFSTSPQLVQAFMAGGKSSVFRSKEGAEDRGKDGRTVVNKKMKAGDVLIGIAASGVTAYVREALKAARRKKVKTILVTCNPKVERNLAQVTVALNTGPEVITGSTRLKAGTATKLTLNSITVVSMARLGKVYGNRMVDLQPRSKKLTARAQHLIQTLGRVSPARAKYFLKVSNGQAKLAILMARKKWSYAKAVKQLKSVDGHLHKLIGPVKSL